MAIGKSIKKSFYADSEAGAKDIAMPPLDHEPTSQPASNESQNNNAFSVPSEVPQEVYEEMSKTEEVVEEPIEVNQSVQEESTESIEPKEESAVKESFKAIRQAKEQAEKERDMLMSQMIELQKHKDSVEANRKAAEEPQIDDDIDFNIDADGLVEGKYVKKVTNKLKSLEKQLHKYEFQNQQVIIENKIKNECPDFDKVVSVENVEMLNSQFPDIANTLRDTNDLYSKAKATYSVMKKFGIYREDPHQQDRIKALKNTQKPRPLVSNSPQQGDTPLSKANAFANGLTEELKTQLRKEMVEARKSM